MAKQVKQFRFYNYANEKNYPKQLNHHNLVSGSIFQDYLPILQLGIQSLPGTKFYLNNSMDPIIIGQTGIYELDLQGLATIASLSFDAKSIEAVNNNDNSYLIVDIIYDQDGEG